MMKSEDKNDSTKTSDTENHISWCLRQKRGIKLEESNNTLCKAYIDKATSALNMLDAATEKDEIYRNAA